MSELKCSECGSPLDPGDSMGICSTCLAGGLTVAAPKTPRMNDLPAGQEIAGRYLIRRILGRGGMGVVYLADDKILQQAVALKFLPEAMAADEVAVEQMLRETRKSLELSHPNVLRIYDFVHSDKWLPFISMEFVEGESLGKLASRQPSRVFSWSRVQPLVRQLCLALAYAHGEKIVHRDLKPANVMIDQKGRVKLADFGLAASIADSMTRVTRHMGVSGTPCYMSPQQVNGVPSRESDDIYALGATIYELLTGKPPFHSGEIIHQVINVDPPTIPERLREFEVENDVPAGVIECVQASLAKEPEDRPLSVAAMAKQLGIDLSQVPIGDPQKQTAPVGRNEAGDVENRETMPPDGVPVVKPKGVSWFGIGAVVAVIVGIVFALPLLKPKGANETDPKPESQPPAAKSAHRILYAHPLDNLDGFASRGAGVSVDAGSIKMVTSAEGQPSNAIIREFETKRLAGRCLRVRLEYRTKNLAHPSAGQRAAVNLGYKLTRNSIPILNQHPFPAGTTDWRVMEFDVCVPEGVQSTGMDLSMKTGTGNLWLRNLEISELDPGPANGTVIAEPLSSLADWRTSGKAAVVDGALQLNGRGTVISVARRFVREPALIARLAGRRVRLTVECRTEQGDPSGKEQRIGIAHSTADGAFAHAFAKIDQAATEWTATSVEADLPENLWMPQLFCILMDSEARISFRNLKFEIVGERESPRARKRENRRVLLLDPLTDRVEWEDKSGMLVDAPSMRLRGNGNESLTVSRVVDTKTAAGWAGKRIRLSVWGAAQGLIGHKNVASRPYVSLAYRRESGVLESVAARFINGSFDWLPVQMTKDVPADAHGFFLEVRMASCSGEIRLRDLKLEELVP